MDHGDISGDIGLADFGIPSWNAKHIRLDLNRAYTDHVVLFPTLGRSSFERIYGFPPGLHLTREIFDTTPLRGLDPKTPYARKWGSDPVSIALYEAGAPVANSSEF